jgi:hypothetical protein
VSRHPRHEKTDNGNQSKWGGWMSVQKNAGGILIRLENSRDLAAARLSFLEQARKLDIDRLLVATEETSSHGIRFRLTDAARPQWTAGNDRLQLCSHPDLRLNEQNPEQEILLAMLAGPVAFEFPTYAELAASIRMRRNIVTAARRTLLAFHPSKIERPEDCWAYTEERGFTVLPGKSLIDALRKATQPTVSGEIYAFSCYRATEYVILLGMAQELATSNPALLGQLQHQWESRAIMSGQFHDVFMREYGSMSEPLPAKYYVPGDRLWFRNPDQRSSDVTGYEGSWVFYLGGGQFSNFWDRKRPYTLASKCIEIYHWRHGLCQDESGVLQIDENLVDERVRASLADPAEVERILGQMMKLRDDRGVYAGGGCIDASREYPRWVCPGSSDLHLPVE